MPWYLGNSLSGSLSDGRFWGWGIGFPFLVVWSMVWGGLALWYAAKRGEKWWFIIFLVFHTAGILEILYLAFVVHLFSTKHRPAHKSSGKRT